MANVDFVAIGEKNDNAIAFLVSSLSDTLYGGTAFSISKTGLMVTNRHNVLRNGKQATRLEIQFANTSTRLPARVVKISDPADEELDLALIQIVPSGTYSTVEGVSGSGDIKVGAAVATIGFPLSLELAQQPGRVTTTMSAGLASKHIPGMLLQIDSYGTHGLSGAPVFDGAGIVVGVVYGGPAERDAKVVYAVPSDRLASFLGDAGKGIVR
jgi:S1-C subfamily serine protease